MVFGRLDNWHPRIKLTVELNMKEFLNLKFVVFITLLLIERQPSYQFLGHLKYLIVANLMPLFGIYINDTHRGKLCFTQFSTRMAA